MTACESLLDVLDGLKYIDGNPVALEDGSGYQLNVVSVTQGTDGKWTTKTEDPIVIKHGSKGADGHTPEITIKDGNWWIDDVDTGEKAVPADGKDAPTPTFHIWDGVLWYTFAEKPDTSDNGKPTAEDTKGWTSLGNVVGPKGETGEQGPQGPEGIHGLEITRVTDENDPNYGAIKISYYDGEKTVTEYLPTYEMFLTLKTKVEDAEKNITALQSLANAIDNQIFVTGYELVYDNGIVVGCKISTIKIKSSTDANGKVTYTSETETLDVCPNELLRLKKDAQGWYWEIKGDNTRHYLDAEVTFVPDFVISGGHLYVSLKGGANKDNINDDEYWKDLGTVQTILAGHDGDSDYTSGDPLVSIKQENGKVIFTFAGSDPIEVPTQTAFAALVERVTALENNAQAFNTMLTALKSYKFVKNFEVKKVDGKPVGFIITLASYIEKYENGEFMGYELSTEVQTIDYSDAGLLSVTLVNGEYHWQLPDGTTIPVDGTFVPEFRINDEDGKLYVSLVENPGNDFKDASKWQCLGLVTPEIAAGDKIIVSIEEERNANNEKTGYLVITFRNPSDPNAPNETLRLPTANAFETLKQRVETVNDNLVALQTSFNAHEKNYHVKSISAIPGGLGYTIVYTNNGVDETVTFVNGKDGAQGKTPALRIGEDGYWEYRDEDGDWVDVKFEGEKVSAVGNTPKLKIGEDGFWYVSYQNGADGTWESTNVKATGNDGTDGASFFNYVTPIPALDADGKEIWNQGHKVYAYIEIRVPDGDEDATNDVVYNIPTEWTITQLQAQVDALNGNVAALSELVKGQKYIESYAPKADGTGYDLVIKYYENNQWVTTKLEIINGKNPVLGFVKGDDGYDYWAYADENGNLVKFDPAVRANGVDGKIPEFNLTADGKLQYRFNGTDWTTIDKVLMRDSFFSNVTTIEEEETITDEAGNSTKQNYVAYLEFTLAADGQSYKVPTAKKLQKLQAQVDALNGNVAALSELVKGQKYIESYAPKADGTGYDLVIKYYENNQWVTTKLEIINGKNPVLGFVKGDDGYDYWAYADENGNLVKFDPAVRANGVDGKIPEFNLTADGKLQYRFNGTDWTTIDKVLMRDSFFSNVKTIEEEETLIDAEGSVTTQTYVAYLEFTLAADGQSYQVPTARKLQKLQAQVDALNSNVQALQTIVNALEKNQHVISYETYYVDGVEKGYKLILTDGPDNDTENDELIIYHGNIPSVYIGDDGYWYINDKKTDYEAAGKTPTFKIENNTWKVSYDGGQSWYDIPTTGEASDYKIVSITEETVQITDNGTTKTEVEFITISLSNNKVYKIPTAYRIQQMQKAIDSLDGTIDLLSGCLEGKTFITDVREVKDQETGYITGYNVTSVTINDLKPGQPQTTSFSSLVVPFKSGDKWFIKILTGYDNDQKPIYEQIETGSSSLRIEMLNGDLYYSTDPAAGNDSQPIPGEHGWNLITTLPYQQNGDLFGGTLNKVTKNGDYVEFTFGTNNTLKVPVYFESPTVSFFTDAEWTNKVSSVELAEAENSKTLYFKVKGSFTEGQNPEKMYATCEGNWVSTNLSWDAATKENGVIYVNGQVEVKPSSGYIGDNYSGKLTLHIPYYSTTGYGQIDLSAKGNLDYEILELNASNKASFSITTDMIPDGQLPVIAYNYGDEFRWIHSTVERDASTPGRFKITVNCDRNIGDARTGTIVVFNQKGGRELLRLKVPQEGFTGKIHNLAHPTGTGAIVPANCYIITGQENTTNDSDFLYMIPAYKGNDTNADKFRGIKKYEVLWNDSGNTINIDQDSQLDEMILFTVTGNNPGNAVIAIKDKDDKILWSWHLWFCPGGNPADEESLDTYGSVKMMDRNLGAASPASRVVNGVTEYVPSRGLYYQWGRKDPFAVDEQTGGLKVENPDINGTVIGSQEDATKNPKTYDTDWNPSTGWSESKTIYDPCPPGYRVASTYVWGSESASLSSKRDYVKIGEGNYPLDSYYDHNGSLVEPISSEGTDIISDYKYEYNFWGQRTFECNITYNWSILENHGEIWSSMSGRKLDYSYKLESDPQIVTITPEVNTGLSSIDNAINNAIKSAVQNDMGFPKESAYRNAGTEENNASALQVRCVKE